MVTSGYVMRLYKLWGLYGGQKKKKQAFSLTKCRKLVWLVLLAKVGTHSTHLPPFSLILSCWIFPSPFSLLCVFTQKGVTTYFPVYAPKTGTQYGLTRRDPVLIDLCCFFFFFTNSCVVCAIFFCCGRCFFFITLLRLCFSFGFFCLPYCVYACGPFVSHLGKSCYSFSKLLIFHHKLRFICCCWVFSPW